MNSSLRTGLIGVGMIAMVTLGYATQHFLRDSPSTSVGVALTVLQPPQSLAEFVLLDDRGSRFDHERLRGRWTFLFFGYTHCPDVCPSTMQTLKAMRAQIGGNDKNVQYVFVSVDPARDTPALLGQYVRYFNSEFVGATGPEPELARLAKSFGSYYERVGSGSDYHMNHSAAIFLVGPDARFRALLPQPHVVPAIADEFAKLRQR